MNQPIPTPPPMPQAASGTVPTGPAVAHPGGNTPVIGVDPGARWTAACLRRGHQAVTGWTLGPVDVYGRLQREALDDIDDWAAFDRYLDRISRALDALVDRAKAQYGPPVVIGVETPVTPRGVLEEWRSHRIPPRDWVIPKMVTAGVLFAYPGTRLVAPAHLGQRGNAGYPPELKYSPPPGWGPSEAPKGTRDHERSAYDVAGVAAGLS